VATYVKALNQLNSFLVQQGMPTDVAALAVAGQEWSPTDSGLAQVLRRRGTLAGMPKLHPHLFRHTFAHQWLSDGDQIRRIRRDLAARPEAEPATCSIATPGGIDRQVAVDEHQPGS